MGAWQVLSECLSLPGPTCACPCFIHACPHMPSDVGPALGSGVPGAQTYPPPPTCVHTLGHSHTCLRPPLRHPPAPSTYICVSCPQPAGAPCGVRAPLGSGAGEQMLGEATQPHRQPDSQNDPPTPRPSSRPSQQGHAVRPPAVLVSLDADRSHGGVWRILTRPQPPLQPTGPFPVPRAVLPSSPNLQGGRTSAPRTPPSQGGEAASFRNHHEGVSQAFPPDLGPVLPPSRPLLSRLENWEGGWTRNLPRSFPSLAGRFSQKVGEGA